MITQAIARTVRAVTTVLLVVVPSSCKQSSEIVLVVDTDMTVPSDLDHVGITVAGATQSRQLDVELAAVGAPVFPLTLGLTPAGALSPVTVTVNASLQGTAIVEQAVQTGFVDGEQRMLRVLLESSCMGVFCPTNQSCQSGVCGSIDRPATNLPPWTGTLPPRPGPATRPIAGRTVWSSGWHSAAVEGTVLYAWGQNSDGQLGTGNTQNAIARRPVMNVKNPASIGLGQLHSCYCDTTGQAFCWGRNVEGQLGTGNTSQSLTPIAVPGLTDCVQIAGGAKHTCAIHVDRTVSCWGQNTSGQVGQTAATTPVTSPMLVPNITDVADVQCGELYTCVRKADGTVQCWGDNKFGQLGDGTMTARATTAAVTGLTDIVEMAIGRFFACARHMAGTLSCWGQNDSGQLGSSASLMIPSPVDIVGISDASQMAIGQEQICIIHRTTGIMSCWGNNKKGQLGNGTLNNSAVPVDVVDIQQVTSISAGSVHTCARHSAGLACWGENIVNQLGDGSTTNRSRPVSVAGFL
jgi:alpha-tubulin suppressor-like RCC1 family protein